MKKLAEFNWNLLIPGAGLIDPSSVSSKGLPQIFKGDPSEVGKYNDAAWHTIGSAATLSALVIAFRLAANAAAKRDLEKARARAHENKVNAMYAYSTPNTAPQTEAVKKVRALGVSKDASMEKIALDLGEVAIRTAPIALSIPAALMVSKIIDDQKKSEAKDEADERLAEARNKLDALQAKLLKLRLKKSANAISEVSEPDEDAKKQNQENNREEAQKLQKDIAELEKKVPEKLRKKAAGETLTSLALLATALATGMAGVISYKITKSKDEERKRKQLLEKQVYAQNLTNTPPKIELLLGKHQPFPDDESRQTYIKEISKAVK